MEKAVDYYEKSLEIYEKYFGKGCVQSIDPLENLTFVHLELDMTEKAINFVEQCVDIRTKLYGEDDPSTVTALNALRSL